MSKFQSTFEYKLIYVVRFKLDGHKGILKIGDTTISTQLEPVKLTSNCKLLNSAAKDRIKQYTNTAGVDYELLYTTLAIKDIDGNNKYFRDYEVHEVLKRSGYEKIKVNGTNSSECFRITPELAIDAIDAVKSNKSSINHITVQEGFDPIKFRPEQDDAIDKTVKKLKKDKKMLWNAKMRFGKTLCTLEVIKKMEFSRTIIISHRPIVDNGWYDDYKKIFEKHHKTFYSSKNNGEQLDNLLRSNEKFIYFASIQDLRGSDASGGKFDKNNEIFDITWDFVVIDEAHEGTTTNLGESVKNLLIKEDTKLLELSGTPFSILQNYKEDELYTWDYVMEQKAKDEYPVTHFGDSNPYESLPRLNMFTYNLGHIFSNKAFSEIEDQAFNFREFFRTWTGEVSKDHKSLPVKVSIGDFVHENDIISFLNLLTNESDSNYPFSNKEYQKLFQHTLWMIPGVKEGKALSKLLKEHPIFGSGIFDIINVAGDGDQDEESNDALDKVKTGIASASKLGRYTITLSCGKLTTGVTIPEWTAVLMLSGSYATSAANYLQTIFRVQSPANIDGKIKTNCYVFDFAPDRTLKMVADAVNLSARAGKTSATSRVALGEFLNYCPVIGIDGSLMKTFDTNILLQQLKRAYAERAVANGFDDTSIYNDIELSKLTENDLKKFAELHKIVGSTKSSKKTDTIDVNENGLTDEQYKAAEEIKNKKIKERTPEDLERLEQLKKAKDNRNKAISNLRAISIRIPLLIYGAKGDFDESIAIEDLLDDNIIDPESWKEFMPKDITKELFKEFIIYYDADVFMSAGKNIRSIVKYADTLSPTERVKRITQLFKGFKNPDKETVLTPWRVVNMHMGSTLGGYSFFDTDYEVELDVPRFIENKAIENHDLLNKKNVKILEINSKTGLYPLYLTYSLFRSYCNDLSEMTVGEQNRTWRKIVSENIYVICKTPMAMSITYRTLLGFNHSNCNMHHFKDLIGMLKNKPNQFISKVLRKNYWRKEGGISMKFDAVVGNPPYQENIDNRGEQPPVYHLFYDAATKISDIVTLITPARFLFNIGKTPTEWNDKMLNDKHFKVVKYMPSSKDVFSNVDIKGGVSISLINKSADYGEIGTFIQNEEVKIIVDKVKNQNDVSISTIMYSNTSYKYNPCFFIENPSFKERVSGGSTRYLSSSVFDKFPEVFFENVVDESSYIQIIGRQNSTRKTYWIKSKYINPPSNCQKYKVLLASSNGSGTFGEKLSQPIIAYPGVGTTETFISFGSFDTLEEAQFLYNYLQTKFARFLLSSIKVTQGNKTSKVWNNVPLVGYEECYNNRTIKELDQILYKKYNLDSDEIAYIEQSVEPM